MEMNSLYLSDGYKIAHHKMLTPGATRLAGNWTPRSNKHAPKECQKVVNFGQQAVLKWLVEHFDKNFFAKNDLNDVGEEFSLYLGSPYDMAHFKALHKLGYLPIEVLSLPEGVEVPMRVPTMFWVNTHDDFPWLPLYLETILSNMLWKPATSATLALAFERIGTEWCKKTDVNNLWFVKHQFHDFSLRGLGGLDGGWLSGLGHAIINNGSDTLPVIPMARKFYNAKGPVISSVPASEHSVSSSCIATMGELEMIRYYMKQYPTGILSIVSDTFDLWTLINEYLPVLKDEIMSRDGKIVIRPDSGDPVDIICGLPTYTVKGQLRVEFKTNYFPGLGNAEYNPSVPAHKGVIELLWDIFGGTINEQGYKVLDPHIGAIYGDSINLTNAPQIFERLAAKGFASTNIVLGVGSFTYQYNTRDTFSFAAKGTWVEVKDRSMFLNTVGDDYELKHIEIYKDPVTDSGTKKSAKGLLAVYKDAMGEYVLHDQVGWKEVRNCEFQTILKDGVFYNEQSFEEIRERIKL